MPAVTEITQLLHDLSSGAEAQRVRAAERLAQLGPDAQPAAVGLVRACGDVEPVRTWAAGALEKLGVPQAAHVRELIGLTGNECSEVAYWAVTLLGRLKSPAELAVPALTQTLAEHPQLVVRQRAAWALGEFGPAAADALVVLRHSASSDDPRLASMSQRSIERISS
jgi:HEAT repeat protein